VFGIYAPGEDVARAAFFALYALQQWGQESAGIATSDDWAAYVHKGTGLVHQVFHEDNLRPLKGHLAIGQNRYSTTGGGHLRNAQPYLIETIHSPLGVGHNGNLTNALDLRLELLERGVGLSSSSDSEVITQLLAAPLPGGTTGAPDWEERIAALMAAGKGVIMPNTAAEAEEALRLILKAREFGEAGDQVVIEERLAGPEAQAILPLLDNDLLEVPDACVTGRLGEVVALGGAAPVRCRPGEASLGLYP
jgi:glutamate synthase domain-containing protein 1